MECVGTMQPPLPENSAATSFLKCRLVTFSPIWPKKICRESTLFPWKEISFPACCVLPSRKSPPAVEYRRLNIGKDIMTFRCAILDDYQDCALGFADWASLHDVEVKNFTRAISTTDELGEFEIIVAMRERTRFDAVLFARLPRLKLLITTGMRNAAIDLAVAAARGIAVCGTRSLSFPAPELTWGLLLALARQIPAEVAAVREGNWQTQMGVGLTGKTLGIVGLGKIGSQIARYAQAFDM